MASLVLGPLLRHIGATDATVWVETDAPCEVQVLGGSARTFTAGGHHYALVVIDGLEPDSITDYQVTLDEQVVWPRADDTRPAPHLRTLPDPAVPGGRDIRLAFGSCRYARADAVGGDRHFDADALVCLARRLADTPARDWPHALALLGDQVYADETTEATQKRIRAKRDITRGAKEQVADFEEYTWLYDESWTDPDVRWLLSTLPSSMIFDDHDVRDDWNTSGAWREDMARTDWWAERIIGGLSSYWIYQHIGNLSPAALAEDDVYARVLAADGDVEPLLRRFAVAADREADGGKGARWSYRRDLGSVRLLVIDSRCGRVLADGRRSMVDADEQAWLTDQLDGDYDHLLIGTSLPWLLPRALHDLEAWNEVMADGARGRLVARWSEKIRRAGDLEHWASFGDGFRWLANMIASVGRGEHGGSGGRPPATICVLSGDVHHAYAARAVLPSTVGSAVWQLTCSPLNNYVPAAMKVTFRLAWSRAAERSTRALLRILGPVPRAGLSWHRVAGPYFGNELMTFTARGRRADVVLEKSGTSSDDPLLRSIADLRLTQGPDDARALDRSVG